MTKSVAVLGAGSTMGLPMTRNIARAGFEVRAWNRTREKAEALAEEGAEVFDTPADAAARASVIVTMLADADAVLETAEAAFSRGDSEGGRDSEGGDGPEGGALWLQMSTIGEAGTERCVELAGEHSVAFVDAPVLGTKQPAEQKKLVILASGPQELRDRAQPIFDAVGQKTLWIGEPGMGTRLKIVVNSWVLTVTEGCAETIALAQGMDVDPSLLFDALDGGTLDLPYLRMKGKAILEHDFEPMFSLKLAAKDAGLIEQSAQRHQLDLPLFATISQRMAQGVERHGDEDMSATYFTSAPAGVAG